MFEFFKKSFQKIYHSITEQLSALFSRSVIDEATFADLERLLLQADTGTTTTRLIMDTVKKECKQRGTVDGIALKEILRSTLKNILKPFIHDATDVYVLVGINGSGKTTSAAKMAYRYQQMGKKVLLVAADTFRAAAVEQLQEWATALNIDLVHVPNTDPGTVVFKGCKQYSDGGYDLLIIDTAGRLQTKTNLMHELAKLKKIITKQLPTHRITTLLTVDAMLGQNSLEQAKLFHESTDLNGIILTKMDGTGKGGIVFAINNLLSIPVAFVSAGEQKEQFDRFDASVYVDRLLEK